MEYNNFDLRGERRNDFFVDEIRKKVWSVEIDILKAFDAFCSANSLTYFADYGRVPFDGAFMQEYADNRYNRLKNNI